MPSLIANYYFDFGFWWSELAIGAALVVLSVLWFLYRQRAQYTKTIYDFPNKGEKRSIRPNGSQATSTASYRCMSARPVRPMPSTKGGRILTASLGAKRTARNCRKRGLRATTPTSEAVIRRRCSRLSDISLQWMLEEILKLDHPVKFGPVTVNGEAVAGTGTTGTPLHLYPDATSMQHSEIAGTQDTIDAFRERLPRILRGLLANTNYDIIKRSILPQAKRFIRR